MPRSPRTRARAVAAALLLSLLALAPAAAAATAGEAEPAPAAILAELVQDVGGRGAAQTPQRYAYLHKLDGHLQDVAASRLGTGSAAAAEDAADRQGVTTTGQASVAVDVYVTGSVPDAARALRALGMQVTAISERAPQRMVEGYLPAEALPAAAALASTRAILTALTDPSSGAVTSQGDAATRGPQARLFGPNGAGISVGVISDSIDRVSPGVAGSQASGDLPANVVSLGDSAAGRDEGRAMAEIIYDEAPGISGIVFATADGGPAAKAATIDALVARGVRVIADDTSYVTEPFFQDGVISQAVDRAKAAGVAYIIAAGNDGRQSWEGGWNGGTYQDFDPGAAVDAIQTVGTFNRNELLRLVLQWAEPWGRAANDFAIDVYRNNTTAPWITIDTNNTATGIPEEWRDITVPSDNTVIKIAIRRVSGAGAPYLKYSAFTNGGARVAIEHPVVSGAVAPDAASANGALTVSASRYSTPTTPEAFSSRGPVMRLLDAAGTPLPAPELRQKPNVGGPDGVATSVRNFASFFGTSAAAPAVAGIAALILSAKPQMSIDTLYSIMTNPVNALDCPAAGNPDIDCGSGFLLADRALGMALDGTPPVVTAAVSPATPDGTNGWYRGAVSVTWTLSDGESPIISPVGCGATAPGDGVVPITCSATSAGGTTTVPVTIKRDSTPPAAPALLGIRARSYAPRTLPKAKAIACRSFDSASGVIGCSVTGFSARLGKHTLTATATNGAGLTSTATLGYVVAKPKAISKLKLGKGVSLARVARSGLSVKLRVAGKSTRLVATLAASIPRTSGSGTRTIALGRLTRKASAGTANLRIALTARAREQLAEVTRATLTVTIAGSARGARKERLRGSVVARRAG